MPKSSARGDMAAVKRSGWNVAFLVRREGGEESEKEDDGAAAGCNTPASSHIHHTQSHK